MTISLNAFSKKPHKLTQYTSSLVQAMTRVQSLYFSPASCKLIIIISEDDENQSLSSLKIYHVDPFPISE